MIRVSKDEQKALIDLANEVRLKAYAPYSKYQVGAALRGRSGRIYTGCNVENAAYPTGICAERAAVFHAVAEGEREFDVIAVATINGGTPCGSCRQVLAEFGLNTRVLIADGRGKLVKEITVADLLPDAFTPEKLNR